MPFRDVEPEPVGEPVQPGHFANGNAAVEAIVDGAGAGERATGRVGARSERVGNAVRCKLEES